MNTDFFVDTYDQYILYTESLRNYLANFARYIHIYILPLSHSLRDIFTFNSKPISVPSVFTGSIYAFSEAMGQQLASHQWLLKAEVAAPQTSRGKHLYHTKEWFSSLVLALRWDLVIMSVIFGRLVDGLGLFRVHQLATAQHTAIYIVTHNFLFPTNPFSIRLAGVLAPKVDGFFKIVTKNPLCRIINHRLYISSTWEFFYSVFILIRIRKRLH